MKIEPKVVEYSPPHQRKANPLHINKKNAVQSLTENVLEKTFKSSKAP